MIKNTAPSVPRSRTTDPRCAATAALQNARPRPRPWREPLPAGWNEVTAKVGEVLFLGESQTCHVVTVGGTEMTVKALSAAGMPMQPGDTVKVRWAVADACIYTEWAESDLSKAAGAH